MGDEVENKNGKHFSHSIRSMVFPFRILAWCDAVWFGGVSPFDINTVLFFTAIHLLPLFTYDFMMNKTAYVRMRFRLTKTAI